MICTDADRYSIKQRKDQLESFCQESGIVADSRNPNEPVMIWIPRHSIENWIHFFRDYPDKVSEETVYPHGGDPVKCREEAYIMSDYLQDISDFQEALQSLEDAKEEYRTLCNNQL